MFGCDPRFPFNDQTDYGSLSNLAFGTVPCFANASSSSLLSQFFALSVNRTSAFCLNDARGLMFRSPAKARRSVDAKENSLNVLIREDNRTPLSRVPATNSAL